MHELDEATRLADAVERYFKEPGVVWLRELSQILDRLVQRWSLELGPHFPDLWINYVAPAIRADGTKCVLKVGFPNEDLAAEIESLRYWGGRGIVRLLDADAAEGALLLERLQPGTMLAELSAEDDDAATRAAAVVMATLWRPPPARHNLIDLSSWFGDLLGHRHRHGGPGRFPSRLFDRAEGLARELLASIRSPVMLHGDLHHFNILRARRDPWLAIDPKGLIGDAGFDIAAFLRNPRPQPAKTLARRLEILSAELGLDRQRVQDWCFVEAVLNACWSHQEPEVEFDRKLAWAELLLTL